MTIYERHAVCSDTTWDALTPTERAEYDYHHSSWADYLAATKTDLVAINLGCREVIIWDEFGELPYFAPAAGQIGTNDVNNYTMFRAHSSARNNGSVTDGLKMAGMRHNYQMDYALFDGFIFDERTDGTEGNNYYFSLSEKHVNFENCIFANIYYGLYNLRQHGYYKNCLFYNFNIYMRNDTGAVLYNCGFYTVFSSSYSYIASSGCFYNCWAYAENRGSGLVFKDTCTGDNNYATDGSGPIAPRTLSTFGFADPVNGDFSITSASPLFDSGKTQGEELGTDIAGNPREQGANVDIGMFEVPVLTRITLDGVIVGSVCGIINADTGDDIVPPFTANTPVESVEFSLPATTNISIRVRKGSTGTRYKPWRTDFALTSVGATIYVSQTEIPLG